MKQLGSKVLFKLRNLSTDGRLLNAIRHLARSRGHAAMTHNVIEKLEMMNVNAAIIT
jgi:hypothetical protein